MASPTVSPSAWPSSMLSVSRAAARAVVALVDGQPGGTVQGADARQARLGHQGEEFVQALPALGVVSAQGPERGHGGGHPQRGGRGMIAVPADGRADVVVLDLDPLEPVLPGQARLHAAVRLDQGQERGGVSGADPVRRGQLVEPFGRILADRLQQRVTHRTGAAHLAHQVLVEELGQAVEHRQADVRRGVADRLDRLQAGAAGEHRTGGEEPPGLLGEQVMAPGDRRPQGLLPVRQVAAAAGEQAQRVLQPGQDRLRRQQLDPRRGQLEGQRQAVQPAGDLGDRRRVPLVDGEVRQHRGGPLGEQAHRLAPGQRFGRGTAARVRDGERRDRAFLLAGDPQRRAAADQDAQRAGLPQQPGHRRGAGQQVLEVVQDEQDLPLVQLADQVVHQRPVPGVLQPEALRDGRRHQPRIPDGCQRHEVERRPGSRPPPRRPARCTAGSCRCRPARSA